VLGVYGALVVIVFGEFGNDVPRVEKAGNLEGNCQLKGMLRGGQRERTYPRMKRRMLIIESAEQIPRFTQTAEKRSGQFGFVVEVFAAGGSETR